MNLKMKIKVIIDFLMTILLLWLMAFQITGQEFHEWFGAGMLVLFLLHNVLNYKWYKNILKGRYSPVRVLQSVVNFAVLLSMFCLAYSGIVMSHYVFGFVSISGQMALARQMHMVASYWGFILMSVHIGIHFHTVISMVQKKISKPDRILNIISKVLCAAISAYGLYVFLSQKISDYLFLKTQFVFLDFSKPIIVFVFNYISMMILFGAVGYYISNLLRLTDKSRRKNGGNT